MQNKESIQLIASLLKSDQFDHIGLKLFILEKIVLKFKPGTSFKRQELVIILEDYPALIPENTMLNLLESLGVFLKTQNGYVLEEKTPLSRIINCSKRHDRDILIDDIKNIFTFTGNEKSGWGIRDIRAALAKGLKWNFDITRIARQENFQGLPAYWECMKTEDEPLGILQAGTCNVDALCIMAESLWSSVPLTALNIPDKKELIQTLVTYNLNCQLPLATEQWEAMSDREKEWNYGGLMPYEDQPSSFHPTVESTADLVLSLSILFHFYEVLTQDIGDIMIPKNQIGQAIIDGVQFLLRMQLADGGWGIYRYLDDKAKIQAHQNPSYLTVCSFGLSKMCGVFDALSRNDLYPLVNGAIGRYIDFLMACKIESNGTFLWAPGFEDKYKSVHDAFETSTKVYRSLFSITKGMEKYKAIVYPMLQNYIYFIKDNWSTNYKALARYPFRSPLRKELNDSFNYWEIRLDVLMCINLLDWHNGQFINPEFKLQFTDNLWEKIEKTIGELLHEQHGEHGHWNDPDNGRPFVVSTLYAMEALNGYLDAIHYMTRYRD